MPRPDGLKHESNASPVRAVRWYAWLAIVGAALLVYANALAAPLVLDDPYILTENRAVRDGDVWAALAAGGNRCVANASFALNRRLLGPQPVSYRAMNVLIHALAGIILFELLRSTLIRVGAAKWGAVSATHLALIVALMWAVHPLATQGVTYIVQRMESLAALFYLIALWSIARGAASRRSWAWYLVSIAACWLGVGTKETLITLPVVAALYDRAFLAGNWRDVWRQRWFLHLALAAGSAWLVWQSKFLLTPAAANAAVGWQVEQVSTWDYLRTQPLVVLHYLRLALFPVGQSFDYGWQPSDRTLHWAPALLLMSSLVAATGWLVWRRPQVGFLPAAFFLYLAPTSSVVPILDLAVEHRMYLPLAAVVAGAVLLAATGYARWIVPRLATRRPWAPALAVALGLVVALASIAVVRNQVYQSKLTLWADVAQKSPQNPRGHSTLAAALTEERRYEEAMVLFQRAAELDKRYRNGLTMYAERLCKEGRTEHPRELCLRALNRNPRSADAHAVLGMIAEVEGNTADAQRHYRTAVELDPRHLGARCSYAGTLTDAGEFAAADAQLSAAQALDDDAVLVLALRGGWFAAQQDYDNAQRWYARAVAAETTDDAGLWTNYGQALFFSGRRSKAINALRRAVAIDPQSAPAHNALANVYASEGNAAQAEALYRSAIELDARFAEAQLNLGNLLRQSQPAAARKAYEAALAIDPQWVEAHNNLGILLAESDPTAAERHLLRALQLAPRNPQAHCNLANLYLLHGRDPPAIEHYRQALAIDPDFAPAIEALAALTQQPSARGN